jgi:hypothetical protein
MVLNVFLDAKEDVQNNTSALIKQGASEAFNKQRKSSTRYTANHDSSSESSDSSICSPKQKEIQKLNENRYCPNFSFVMKKKWLLLSSKMF